MPTLYPAESRNSSAVWFWNIMGNIFLEFHKVLWNTSLLSYSTQKGQKKSQPDEQ